MSIILFDKKITDGLWLTYLLFHLQNPSIRLMEWQIFEPSNQGTSPMFSELDIWISKKHYLFNKKYGYFRKILLKMESICLRV